MNRSMPVAEFEISIALVRKLLKDQKNEFNSLKVSELGVGWDNHMFKLGTDKIIRLPRAKAVEALLMNELNFLPLLKPRLDVNIPIPIFKGLPCNYYPVHWSIVPYFEGDTANKTSIESNEVFRFAKLLKALHSFKNPASMDHDEGSNLVIKATQIEERIERVKAQTKLFTSKIKTIIELGLNANQNVTHQLIHADIHPRNVIIKQHKIAALIDWGDMTIGDPARDLSSLWILFDDQATIIKALNQYGASHDEILRSKTWAIYFGIIMLDSGMVDHPEHEAIGRQILKKMA